MRLTFAKFISLLLNPVVIALFAPFFLIYKTTHNFQAALHWASYTLIFLVFLAFFAFVAVKKKIFTDLDVSRREQRSLMFIVSILFASSYLITLFFLHAPKILYFLVIGIIFGIAFLSVINRKVKASIHTAALTALILPVAISYGNYYYYLLFLIPIVIWARLKTKRHTFKEIFIGGTVGGFLSVSLYYITRFFMYR